MGSNWQAEARIFPIQIREDLIVRIQDLPHDLTAAEADRICRVIRALAHPTPGDSPCRRDELVINPDELGSKDD